MFLDIVSECFWIPVCIKVGCLPKWATNPDVHQKLCSLLTIFFTLRLLLVRRARYQCLLHVYRMFAKSTACFSDVCLCHDSCDHKCVPLDESNGSTIQWIIMFHKNVMFTTCFSDVCSCHDSCDHKCVPLDESNGSTIQWIIMFHKNVMFTTCLPHVYEYLVLLRNR
jgi:hypothetical protein